MSSGSERVDEIRLSTFPRGLGYRCRAIDLEFEGLNLVLTDIGKKLLKERGWEMLCHVHQRREY